MEEEIRLTNYSHGAGCGCKIAPDILSSILKSEVNHNIGFKNLITGNEGNEDAAVFQISNGQAVISTTDFFMPIVDDPFEFGKIAGANAISDIYAMGGTPLMAIAILGWPIEKIPTKIASRVIEGGRAICKEAGIPLAGGHSIDSPEPIFGLAVTGICDVSRIKKNSGAKEGDLLFLTKSLGTGILSTAEKKGILNPLHIGVGANSMIKLNVIGSKLSEFPWIHSMTDVTGFGLLGHLIEMCEASGVHASINFDQLQLLTGSHLFDYILDGSVPGGTLRNLRSYEHKVSKLDDKSIKIMADPQTSGGLLIAASPDKQQEIRNIFSVQGLEDYANPIGQIVKNDPANGLIVVNIN